MSWQDELRRLDAELASGKISLHQHRKQRDELLATVSGGFRPAPPPTQPPTELPTQPPAQQAQLVTHAVLPDAPLPGLAPAPHHAGHVPPLPTTPVRPSRRGPTWLFVSLGLFLVLAMIVGATWFLGAGGTTDETSDGRANTTTAPGAGNTAPRTGATAVPMDNRMPALPGTPDVNNSTVSVAKGVELGLYPAQAADTFLRNGVQQVVYRGSSQGDDNYFVLALQAGDPAKAKVIVDYLYRGALSGGFTPVPSVPSTVTGAKSARAMRGTWYSSGDTAVVAWVSQPEGLPASRLTQHLDETVTALRQALPAER